MTFAGATIRLTADSGHLSPLWTPDSLQIVYEAGPSLRALPPDGRWLAYASNATANPGLKV